MRVMKGPRVEARFRRKDADCWIASGVDGCSLSLSGWYKDAWLDHEYDVWAQCQVYDPPAWFLNKPDPGEGFRLLGKFPHEAKETADEWYDCKNKNWIYASDSKDQRADVWYRRRIANNPEIPDSCDSSETPNSSRSREDIPSGWRLLGKDEARLASDAYWSLGAKDWVIIGDDRVAIANELPRWHAIRQVVFYDHQALQVNGVYTLPGGQTIRITAKGFEVV